MGQCEGIIRTNHDTCRRCTAPESSMEGVESASAYPNEYDDLDRA